MRKTAFCSAFMLALTLLTGCGDDANDQIKWKLNGATSKTYSIKVIGTARLETDLFSYERENFSVNGKTMTVSIKDESFLTIKKTKGTALEGEVITGPTSFVTYPAPGTNNQAKQALNEIFNKGAGISLGKFAIEQKGTDDIPTTTPFLATKIMLRTPDGETYEKKQGSLARMAYANEQMCLNLYNRKIRTHQIDSNITINQISTNEKGEVLAEMRYIVTEKVETEYQEGDFARRTFLRRFNDGNYLGLRPLPEDDDDVQKIYTCKYKGRHVFNLTRGWLESVTADQSIEVLKILDDGPKATELLRAKIMISLTNQKIVPLQELDELDFLGTIVSNEDAPDQIANQTEPAAGPDTPPSPTPLLDPEALEAFSLPTSVPTGNSLPDPDIDTIIDNSSPPATSE